MLVRVKLNLKTITRVSPHPVGLRIVARVLHPPILRALAVVRNPPSFLFPVHLLLIVLWEGFNSTWNTYSLLPGDFSSAGSNRNGASSLNNQGGSEFNELDFVKTCRRVSPWQIQLYLQQKALDLDQSVGNRCYI
jgi:hypothetical protein